jgi:outer membrane protein W
MKNFGTLLIFAFMFTLVTQGYTQTFGVKAGLNLSNMHSKDNNDTYDDNAKMNPGFHLGATAEFPLTEMFSFETGLMLSTKGTMESYKDTYSGNTYESKVKLNLFYLDIPLTAKASYDIGGAKIYGAFGPYLGVGLSGKIKSEVTGETATTEDVKWGSSSSNDYLKRFDYGMIIGAGAEIKAIQIGLSYGLGLANISSDFSDGMMIKNRVLEISVGYKFGGKK